MAGAGNICLLKNSFWGSFHNQALLAENRSPAFGISYNNRFNISQLATRSAGIIIPAGKTSIGLVYSTFGYSDFHRNLAGIACGMPLSEKLSAGIQIDYFAELVPGDYRDQHKISGEIGVLYDFTDRTDLGIHISNPVPNSIRENSMPATLRIGAGTELNNLLFASVEAEMTSGSEMLLRMGFEYEAARNFRIRGGFCTENTSFSFVAGYSVRFVKVDMAFATHEKLGITSSISMIFILRTDTETAEKHRGTQRFKSTR